MTHVTRVRAAAYTLSAALLAAAAAAPAATAAPHHSSHRPSHHSTHRIPFTQAVVTATGTPGTYTLKWSAPGVRHVAVRTEDGRTVAAGGSSGDVTVRGLSAGVDRQWFDFVPSRGGSLRLADRLVKLDGAVNFRDAGGYRTRTGQWVKMGEIYRSDSLDKLTAADQAKLRRLGLGTDFDLRMTSEREAAPDKVPSGVDYRVADVLAGSDTFTGMPKTADEAATMMADGERFMVSGGSARTAYADVFSGMTDDDDRGLLFHCTAGKDRTGWANAALLTAIGVPRETVMADYLASNHYRAEANAAALAAMPPEQAKVYKPMLDVRAEYLNAGFDEVRDEFGSFRAYEAQALKISGRELQQLKAELLVG
ncbi:tyrosine-protein phosphatase [Streptomyces durmitorensis]|uniref:Tyrosine-protein phosphatase n=1 Tax=Streptomyces durmitorensis TaxID=319947 RepID=A0ABY4PVZ6_9ACTN|nr:tyrosine-protein phosphatase [Streptomyces durmitorensis]UQT57961.1 tyrosine-protein phosphatase [Streptomyces durmitorensis]